MDIRQKASKPRQYTFSLGELFQFPSGLETYMVTSFKDGMVHGYTMLTGPGAGRQFNMTEGQIHRNRSGNTLIKVVQVEALLVEVA